MTITLNRAVVIAFLLGVLMGVVLLTCVSKYLELTSQVHAIMQFLQVISQVSRG